MTPTKELLKKLYKEYNEKYFYGKLGKCDFSFFSKNISFLGWYCGKETCKNIPNDKIWIGTAVKWTEDALKCVLIHEMIHMYVYRIEGHKYDGIFGHGRRFRKQCKRLKKEFGLDVLRSPNIEYINKKFSPKLWERIFTYLFDR